ncbi:MAG: PKD domain-containing protein, partial [Burkholderiaceae bacterium]
VNDAPGGANNTITATEDIDYIFSVADFGFNDPDGHTLMRVWIDSLPAQGSLLYSGSAFAAGNWVAATDIALGQLTYSPTPNANGNNVASFSFRVQDNGGTAGGGSDTDPTANTITIDIVAVNDAPVPDTGGPYTINEGQSIALDASATTDPDSGSLTYRWDLDNDGAYDDLITASPTATVTWATLNGLGIDDDGAYAIGLQVDDGSGGMANVSTTLTIANTPPTLLASGAVTADGGALYSLNLSHTDPGNDTISSWAVNWGDGTITSHAGDPASVTHSYANALAGLTFDITVSAADEDGTHFGAYMAVPAYGGSNVQVFNGSGGGSLGTFAPSSDGISGHANIVQAPNGKYLVSGHGSSNILEYRPNGALVGPFVASGSNGLSGAAGLAFGPDGNLYVASSNSGKVLRYDASGNFIDEFISSGLNFPLGLTFGPNGDLYVASQGSSGALRFDGNTGAPVGGFNAPNIGATEDITFGPDGYLYAATLNAGVYRLDATTGAQIDQFIPLGVNLASAAGIAFGPDGNLYVADQDADAVRTFAPNGSYLGDYVAPGYAGLDGPAYMIFVADQRVTVLKANEAPSGLDGTPAYVENGSAVVLGM